MSRPFRQHVLPLVAAITLMNAVPVAFAQPGPPPPPPPIPPVPVPVENPITEPKRVLGKLLFWDEQLSSDNTVSCGTCHRPNFGGADPRLARNPGDDGILNTPDDVIASPGVIHCDNDKTYLPDPVFDLFPQITPRAANPSVMAMFSPELFWDGRASSTFTDPQSGLVKIATGGALESQAVGPIVSTVEMGHESRDWNQIAVKLGYVTPMILARNLPTDMADALEANSTYPDLFRAAFGDPTINSERIAFAIATYERTLLANQTPWDRFVAGDNTAMTPNQVQGWNVLRGSPCLVCHTPPLFTNNTFQNVGLRPIAEDIGRQEVTGNPADRGQFKVPTLRNVGLKATYMHTGVFTTLNQVIAFYANGAAQFPNNRSPLLPIGLPPPTVPQVVDFLENGLTDPRVAGEQFPFDRPQLHVELPAPNPSLSGGTTAGTGGFIPRMIANSPPNLMNLDFKIGLDGGLGGAQAFVAWSDQPPVGGQLVGATLQGPIILEGTGAGNGWATWAWPIDETAISSCDVYLQWQIVDAGAFGGTALSQIAHLRMIPYGCAGDMNCDSTADAQDIQPFLEALLTPAAYALNHPGCDPAHGDMNGDGAVNFADVALFANFLTAQ